MVRRRHHLRQVVLQGLAQDRVEGEVGPHDVLLDPHVAAQTLDLLPEAIQILKGGKGVKTEVAALVPTKLETGLS